MRMWYSRSIRTLEWMLDVAQSSEPNLEDATTKKDATRLNTANGFCGLKSGKMIGHMDLSYAHIIFAFYTYIGMNVQWGLIVGTKSGGCYAEQGCLRLDHNTVFAGQNRRKHNTWDGLWTNKVYAHLLYLLWENFSTGTLVLMAWRQRYGDCGWNWHVSTHNSGNYTRRNHVPWDRYKFSHKITCIPLVLWNEC